MPDSHYTQTLFASSRAREQRLLNCAVQLAIRAYGEPKCADGESSASSRTREQRLLKCAVQLAIRAYEEPKCADGEPKCAYGESSASSRTREQLYSNAQYSSSYAHMGSPNARLVSSNAHMASRPQVHELANSFTQLRCTARHTRRWRAQMRGCRVFTLLKCAVDLHVLIHKQ